jgi:hypothetical protein
MFVMQSVSNLDSKCSFYERNDVELSLQSFAVGQTFLLLL